MTDEELRDLDRPCSCRYCGDPVDYQTAFCSQDCEDAYFCEHGEWLDEKARDWRTE